MGTIESSSGIDFSSTFLTWSKSGPANHCEVGIGKPRLGEEDKSFGKINFAAFRNSGFVRPPECRSDSFKPNA